MNYCTEDEGYHAIQTKNNYIYRTVSERVRFQGIFLEDERMKKNVLTKYKNM